MIVVNDGIRQDLIQCDLNILLVFSDPSELLDHAHKGVYEWGDCANFAS